MNILVRLTWKRLAILPALAFVGALAVGWSGLVPIAASSGHFPPFGWFLHWTMQNAVKTQSLLIRVPEGIDLSDPTLVQRAAGHYATGCSSCHGAPGVAQSPVVLAMEPPPPRLEGQVGRWKDRELYWIALHGIKYTGMPSWTTQSRPDEVWAMVGFLRALPDMTAEAYSELALGGPAGSGAGPSALLPHAALTGVFRDAVAECSRCHGQDGRGVGAPGAFPLIAGQPEAYLFETLKAFASGARVSGIMEPAAGVHREETLRQLAAHYASQRGFDETSPAATGAIGAPRGVAVGEEGAARAPRSSLGPAAGEDGWNAARRTAVASSSAEGGPPEGAEGLYELGRRIAEQGIASRKLPACQSCHDSVGRSKNPYYPYLGGQPEWYLATHLQLWKDRNREGTPLAHVMEPIAINMTERQIDAVSLWYSLQPPGK